MVATPLFDDVDVIEDASDDQIVDMSDDVLYEDADDEEHADDRLNGMRWLWSWLPFGGAR